MIKTIALSLLLVLFGGTLTAAASESITTTKGIAYWPLEVKVALLDNITLNVTLRNPSDTPISIRGPLVVDVLGFKAGKATTGTPDWDWAKGRQLTPAGPERPPLELKQAGETSFKVDLGEVPDGIRQLVVVAHLTEDNKVIPAALSYPMSAANPDPLAPSKVISLTSKVRYEALFVKSKSGVKGIEFRIRNLTNQPLVLRFNSGKKYDVIATKGKQTVWQWSRGKMFTQSLGSETIAPKGILKYTIELPTDLTKGVKLQVWSAASELEKKGHRTVR